MCGIVGYINFKRELSSETLTEIAGKMANQLQHRGPDDQGVWCDPSAGFVMAHRRLSIIDTSRAGHQPMQSHCGRYLVSYNGEIYNFKELHGELLKRGVCFKGRSDTEVLLAAFSEWGIDKALDRINGMFAIALWDKKSRSLYLMRDRLGKKPLYYAWMNHSFLFASELKALLPHPEFLADIDRDALASYLRMNYVPAPRSIYKNTFKLMPATYFVIHSDAEKHEAKSTVYWDHRSISLKNKQEPFSVSENEAENLLHDLLKDSVKRRMESDVPLGAFLSGGVDSSLVVALMQTQTLQPIKTFTIGFHEDHFNEANEARTMAAHLGTEHTELYLTPNQAMAVIPKLPHIYDEPFSDMSQIPTYLVSHLARQQVTVALSGDGGDEFFGGYNRHFWVPLFWKKLGCFPYALKYPVLKLLTALSPWHWNAVFKSLHHLLPSRLRLPNPGDKCHRLATMLAYRSPGDMYVDLVSSWKDPAALLLSGEDSMSPFFDSYFSQTDLDLPHQMMYLDATTYLPDDILTKVDRASMAVSLEARAPLLDYRVAEFAWQLDVSLKIRKNRGKYILRKILSRYAPTEMIDRPKMGFGVPIGAWLRGPLYSWVEEQLSVSRLRHDGFFNVDMVREKWQQHRNGQRNWQYCLWNLLMFQLWLNQR